MLSLVYRKLLNNEVENLKKYTFLSGILASLGLIMIVVALSLDSGQALRQREINRVVTTVDTDVSTMLMASNIIENIETTDVEIIPVSMASSPRAEDPIIIPERIEVFEGQTLEELAERLERHMNSTITGKGMLIAQLSVETGIDPYLATAIILHETGCRWNCSRLVNACNNVGGIKGSPRCGSGSFRYYPTLEDGFIGFFDVLYRVYWSRGLTTPEAIGPIYAANPNWPSKIHSYINDIRG